MQKALATKPASQPKKRLPKNRNRPKHFGKNEAPQSCLRGFVY